MSLDPFTFFQISNKCVDVDPTFCILTINIQLTLYLNSKVKYIFTNIIPEQFPRYAQEISHLLRLLVRVHRDVERKRVSPTFES